MNEYRQLKQRIQEIIGEIMNIGGVTGCALVSRDGAVMGRSFDDEVPVPTFAAMAATIFASSEAAASILHLASPSAVLAESEDGSVMVVGAGERTFIAAVLDRGADIPSVKGRLTEIAGTIGEEV
jgi:predicted regulator of Ras-like GTPase activity (Roadblock/LC7/MglB family)